MQPRWWRDHPREYGENMLKSDESGLVHGIIPANTGRMKTYPKWFSTWWDHPREYGENVDAGAPTTEWVGSSPRIRGESDDIVFGENGEGIIPANTGRIPISGWRTGTRWDHPREYGEN